ncbi:MAG: hypothetical protein U9R19_09635 [Bacteroidota bacterium]|nr:hypothetical protein [Bacteroidota bacterium]
MILRKISLLIALLFSVCFVYAQSTIAVEVENNTDTIYVCSVQFNQSVTPNAGSSPTVFTVTAGNTYDASNDFDEDDVNLKGIKCHLSTGGTPDAYISINSGYTSAIVAPWSGTSWNHFVYWDYSGQGTSEHLKFRIDQ